MRRARLLALPIALTSLACQTLLAFDTSEHAGENTLDGSADDGGSSRDDSAGAAPTDEASAPPTDGSLAIDAEWTAPCDVTLLLCDRFDRADSTVGWGTATSGDAWTSTSDTSFVVRGRKGVATTNLESVTSLVGTAHADAQVFAVVLDQSKGSGAGPILRGSPGGDGYAAIVENGFLQIKRFAAGQHVESSMNEARVISPPYAVRFRVTGTNLAAKAWSLDQAEPTSWMTWESDALAIGNVGFTVAGGSVTVQRFEVSP